MRTRKRTEITIETARVVVISGRRDSTRANCEQCDRPVTMVTVDQAAKLAHESSRTIYRWIEDGKLHFFETANGRLLVCLDSIPSATAASIARREHRRQ